MIINIKLKIKRIRNNHRWQVTTLSSGRVLMSSKEWGKALNYCIQEQKRLLNYYAIH
jgi:hypothetical protein